MQLLNVTNLPIYLPYDKAPVPFGDPFDDASCTLASPGVFTVPGYAPTNGDAIAFSVDTGGSLPVALTVGQKYFVVGASGATFNVSATSGGSAINTASAGTLLTAHLLSNETDGVTYPFKTGATVVVLNLSGGTLVLQGAADTGTVFGDVKGPGSYSTLISLTAGTAGLASLSNDWIRVSTAGTLVLLQN